MQGPSERTRSGQLALLEDVSTVVLAGRVVVDDASDTVTVDVHREEVGHCPVTARDRAADAARADLPVVHRLLGEPRLDKGRRRTCGVRDLGDESEPREGGRRVAIVVPGRHVIAVDVRRVAVPDHDQVPGVARGRPWHHIRVRIVAVHVLDRPPRLPLVGGGRVVDVVVLRVDPDRVDVAGPVGGDDREEVADISAARHLGHRIGRRRQPGPHPHRHVDDDHVDVVAAVTRQVEVAVDRIEVGLAACRAVVDGRVACDCVRVNDAARRVRRAC